MIICNVDYIWQPIWITFIYTILMHLNIARSKKDFIVFTNANHR